MSLPSPAPLEPEFAPPPRPRSRALQVVLALGVAGLVAALAGYAQRQRLRQLVGSLAPPSVEWERADPETHGFSRERLDRLREELDRLHTRSFLVAHHGALLYEWYAPPHHRNTRVALAAAAKPIIGANLLLLEVQDGLLRLDAPAATLLGEWRDDAARARISIRNLASHSSGIQDVPFLGPQGEHAEAWMDHYERNPEERFDMALHDVPLVLEPGQGQLYSGVAYYALATALARAASATPFPDLRERLRRDLMRPLEISDDAWRISYSESYPQGDLVLYAIGSGASLTPRALARLGSLVMTRGSWRGRSLIRADLYDELVRDPLRGSRARRAPPEPGVGEPPTGLGWYLNRDGFFPSLPLDAMLALGGGHQVVLVVPSLELVVVRTGGALRRRSDRGFYRVLEDDLLAPLMRTLRP